MTIARVGRRSVITRDRTAPLCGSMAGKSRPQSAINMLPSMTYCHMVISCSTES